MAYLSLLVFLEFFGNVNCYNFLVISPVYGFSHMKFMATIANQLAENGHEVTYFQPFVIEAYQNHNLIRNSSIEILNYHQDEEGRRHFPPPNDLHDAWYSGKYQSGLASIFDMPQFLFSAWEHICRKIFQDSDLHELLKSKQFDVVISETFDFCGLYLADYLQSKSIISVFTGSRLLSITDPLGEPSWLHYLPAPSSQTFGPGSSIFDRINDLWHKYVFGSGYSILFDWQYYQITRIIGEGKVRHWKQILRDVTFHFSNSNPFLDFPVPSISKIIQIGGYDIDLSEVPPISEDLENILGKREITIFVSFGSMVKSMYMPDSYKESMLQLFNSNPNITFLWKYENVEDPFFKNRIPKNVYLRNWFPQQSLLADKRVKLFITHGGLGSTLELAYSGKPAIVIPLIAEQPDNAKMLSRHGSAEIYSKYDISNWTKLNGLVQKIISDQKYQKSADRLAHLLANQPIKPKDLMIRHAEMAAKFGKMSELTPMAQEMGFVEFYNLDILFFGFLIIWIFGFMILKTCERKIKMD